MKKYRNFEEVLKEVGSLGLYQWFIYALMQYSNLIQTMNQNVMAFGKIVPQWRCGIPILDESNTTIGVDYNGSVWKSELTCPDVMEFPAKILRRSSVNLTLCETKNDSDLEFFSQVRAWDLYCDRSFVPTTIISIQMLGIIPGSLLFNHLIDNYGRRWSCHLLNTGVVILGISSAFAHTWQLFAAIRFFIGFLFGGLFMVSVVTQMEIINESDRMWIYALDCWSVANAVLSLIAYLTRDWHLLIIWSNAVCIPLLFLHFFVKESPRWLLQKGRYEEAADVLNHMARWNRKRVTIDPLTLRNLVQFRRRMSSVTQIPQQKTRFGRWIKRGRKSQYSVLDIFHTKESSINFLLLSYAWLATACMAYGLQFQNTSYTGSAFVNYAVAALFRVITQIILFLADKYLKVRRRVMYLISLGLVVAMFTLLAILTIAVDLEQNTAAAMTQRIVGLIASGSMSALWLIIYLLPIELFPTVIRNIAMGGCSVMARIGAVLGPQLLYLKEYWPPTPFVGFLVVAAINFITIFIFLPETSGTTLPDALDDPVKKADDPEEKRMLDRFDENEAKALNDVD